MLQNHLEQLTRGAGHLKPIRIERADPDDLAIPHQKWNAVAHFGRDFTINQKILQLFVSESIAAAAVADDERGLRSPNGDRRADLRNVNALTRADRQFEVFRGKGT